VTTPLVNCESALVVPKRFESFQRSGYATSQLLFVDRVFEMNNIVEVVHVPVCLLENLVHFRDCDEALLA
jgi:hypothetical protein